jgi:glucuronosyltransferase
MQDSVMDLKVILLVLFVTYSVESARILGVFPYPSRSHSILGQALFKELAKQGHDVTYVSPYPFKTPPAKNYRDIGITSKGLFEVFEAEIDASFEETSENIVKLMKMWFDNIAAMQEYFLSDPAVQVLLNSKEKFDVCIIEFLMNESSLGFGSQFDCKVIAMSTFGQVKYINDMLHSPMPLSTTPHPFLKLTDRMNYWERMENIVTNLIEDIGFKIYHYPLQDAIYEKYFKKGKPSFSQMMRHSVSLVLLNTHFSLNFPQAYLPNMVSQSY